MLTFISDSVILNMKSLAQFPAPRQGQYHNIEDRLEHGPSIPMEDSDTRSRHWKIYGSTVKDLLNAPGSESWLRESWDLFLLQNWQKQDFWKVDDFWARRFMRHTEQTKLAVGMIFSIIHVSVALA